MRFYGDTWIHPEGSSYGSVCAEVGLPKRCMCKRARFFTFTIQRVIMAVHLFWFISKNALAKHITASQLQPEVCKERNDISNREPFV